MSKRILTYNGIDLSTFGVHVSGEGAWVKPAPEYERISVPGRSGDVLLYNGRYSNVDITYRFGITKNFDANYTSLIAALLGSPGYHKLVDSKHSGVYRMAMIEKVIEPTMTQQLSAGEFDVTFNCKPQVYLDSGDEATALYYSTSSQTPTITNPTDYEARPLVRITTSDTNPTDFSVMFVLLTGNHAITKNLNFAALSSGSITNPIIYDSESTDAYDGVGKNLNDHLSVSGDMVVPGNARLSIYGSRQSVVSKVEVIPRWWRL